MLSSGMAFLGREGALRGCSFMPLWAEHISSAAARRAGQSFYVETHAGRRTSGAICGKQQPHSGHLRTVTTSNRKPRAASCGWHSLFARQLQGVPSTLRGRAASDHTGSAQAARALLRCFCGAAQREYQDAGLCGGAPEPPDPARRQGPAPHGQVLCRRAPASQ